ncbi:amino acid ABC transporter substrate-binding protein (PAAT family) [Gelidibacter algens]|uniref:Amino acid ABC transporter substrate-binding protein (PAAT family) n=1 Tax=Gelidibacter algens TaxID=49280 RepID=A0A1A7R3W9_9FLAO|nr:transporter substrate-binding domain-containing protein [Gelidibacter algens]OBX25467.1 ABC transporter substrate-binding protein [Gelidibacter algens]RAJ22317.1 amino acid ABC transporter substrate-binding protein (PAAT family) [Gelidibacter algens]
MTLKSKVASVVLFCTTLTIFTYTLHAQETEKTSNTTELLVGVAGSEPFVFGKNSSSKGIAIEIWEDVANKKSWDYTYKIFDTVEDALYALNKGDLNVVVGPISITSQRLEYMRFSQPFYNSSLAVVSRVDDLTIWQKIKPLFSVKLLLAVGIFLIILAIVGTLLWLAERKKSPDQFPSKPADGIGTGMWLAIVTMSTTGYGDKAPITLWGRIIAGSWMIISIIFATSMVAGIASTLTLTSLGTSTVSNVEQLAGRKVATIAASPSEAFLKAYKTKITAVNNLNSAMTKLTNREVDAVVYDRPQLLYYLKNNKDEALYIAKAEYYKQGYGFAFPVDSDLIYEANRALLELAEDQEISTIVDYYLDKDE